MSFVKHGVYKNVTVRSELEGNYVPSSFKDQWPLSSSISITNLNVGKPGIKVARWFKSLFLLDRQRKVQEINAIRKSRFNMVS